ncbi:MAG: hypothetical protein DRN71_02700 [Candidatus Nanohalarchaeota archaeon]|nr:MAG: hypothetical protein DRN71_02700 [Candidatus Nanohaloarchaeota archaeon]
MKFFDFDPEKVPKEIKIFDVEPVAHEYGEGEGPVSKWVNNYVGVESVTAGPYTIDLIEKTQGEKKNRDVEYVLSISFAIGGNKIPGYQSIPLNVIKKIVEHNKVKEIPVDYYPEVKEIFDNLTYVGTTERSGITLLCMLADGKNAVVFDGYDSALISPVPEASTEAIDAILEAKSE